MDTNSSNVVVKTSKGVVACIIIMMISIIGLGAYIVLDKTDNKSLSSDTEKTSVTSKASNTQKDTTKVKVDNKKLQEEIQKVYDTAFLPIYKSSSIVDGASLDSLKASELSKYLTEKGLNQLLTMYNLSNGSYLLGTIFSEQDSDLRPMTIVSSTNDTVIATGQITKEYQEERSKEIGEGAYESDLDNYPKYIIFKKENGTWKVDFFE